MGKDSERNKLAMAMAVGTIISSQVVAGVLIGYLLDRWLKSEPWFLITGVTLGTIGAFYGVYRIASKLR